MARRYHNAYWDWYIGGVLQLRINTRERAEGFPRHAVRRVPGGRSLPEADSQNVHTPTGRMGELPFPRTTRGKLLTVELVTEALTEPSLNSAIHTLEGAFSNRSDLGLLILTPWPGHGSDVWATFATVADLDCDDELVAEPGAYPPWVLEPILALRQADGRWMHWNESGTLGQKMTWSHASGVNVNNTGNAPTDPIITVTGVTAGQDVHVGRTVAGGDRHLWFRNCPAGTLIIDFTNRTAKVGSTLVEYDAADSNWWDPFEQGVPPGIHTIWLGPGAGTGITVDFFSTSW